MNILNRAASLAAAVVLSLSGAPGLDPKLAIALITHRPPAFTRPA